MATNPYTNRVYKSNGEKIIDISDSTVTAADLPSGVVAYNGAGARIVGEAPTLWGLEADFLSGNYTRLEGAVGRNGGTDFDGFTPWQRRRCNMADDGTINAYLGDSNYIEDGTNGQVMIEQPKFYYKVEPITVENKRLRKARYYISSIPREGFKIHPAFIGMDGNIKDYVYEGAYEGYVDNFYTKLYSTAGHSFYSTPDLGRSSARYYASQRGAHWQQMNIQIACMDMLLMIVEYGQFNMQAAIGNGKQNGSTGWTTGTLSSYGNGTYGNKFRTNEGVQWRGNENPWGNQGEWIDGINIYDTNCYIANTYSYDDDTSNNYSLVDYQIATGNNYISAFGYDENYDWLFLPIVCGGNSAFPIGDVMSWQTGGRWRGFLKSWPNPNDIFANGAFGVSSNQSAGYNGYVTGRLTYIL